MINLPTAHRRALAAFAATAALAAGGLAYSASSAAADPDKCVPSPAVPAIPATPGTPAVTQTVPATPDLWWNFSPNKQQGPFEGPPAFPVDPRGTWQGPHANGGPSQGTYGTFQQGNGHGSWFHREKGTPAHVIVITPATPGNPGTPGSPAVTCDDPTNPPVNPPGNPPANPPGNPPGNPPANPPADNPGNPGNGNPPASNPGGNPGGNPGNPASNPPANPGGGNPVITTGTRCEDGTFVTATYSDGQLVKETTSGSCAEDTTEKLSVAETG